MTGFVRLHAPPRLVRRWMHDAGLSLSYYKLRPDAPPKIRALFERSRQRWSKRPEAIAFKGAFANTLRLGYLPIYRGVLFVESPAP